MTDLKEVDLAERLARWLSPKDFQTFRRSSRNQHAANLAKTHYRKLAKKALRFRPIAEALAALPLPETEDFSSQDHDLTGQRQAETASPHPSQSNEGDPS